MVLRLNYDDYVDDCLAGVPVFQPQLTVVTTKRLFRRACQAHYLFVFVSGVAATGDGFCLAATVEPVV